jgi:hypothetical protein
VTSTAFDDIQALEQIAVNLFYGWGYNFYRLENHLRADDQTVRAKVGWLLGQARDSLERAESAWRRTHLPPPTREKPRPDPAALDGAQKLEAMSREFGALEGQIRAHPVPEEDRMTNRYRREAETLQALLQCDLALVGRAETLRVLVADADGDALIGRAVEIEAGCLSIARNLRERQAILQV